MKVSDPIPKSSGKALLPLLAFVALYLFCGLYLQSQGVQNAFYQMPAPVAAMAGIVLAFIVLKGSIEEKFDTLVRGCGQSDIIIMCLIFLLAGAFSAVSKGMGGDAATVNLGLTLIPPAFVSAGIFLISGFLALATGTSVGTVAAITPIAIGLADKAQLHLPLVIAAVIGGAMLGDNLSIISDTTIAATRTQNVPNKDKFHVNAWIILPGVFLVVVLLLIFGRPVGIVPVQKYSIDFIKVLPYLFVLGTALIGWNVFVVLTGGIVFSGAIGFFYGNFTLLSFAQQIYSGFSGMIDIFLLSLLTGGLAYMVQQAGGLQWLLQKVSAMIKGPKSAQVGISALVSLTDAATANNTVSILINGPLAKELSLRHQVDLRRTASLLDIFSCAVQGLIPYGAQVLIAVGLTQGALAPTDLLPYMWYSYLMIGFGLLSIFVPYADRYVQRHPLQSDQSLTDIKAQPLDLAQAQSLAHTPKN